MRVLQGLDVQGNSIDMVTDYQTTNSQSCLQLIKFSFSAQEDAIQERE